MAKLLKINDSTVKLISITPNAEKIILDIARVSSKNIVSNDERDYKLIKHFLTNNEWSPFEHAFMTLEIITSRFITAQLIRHRTFTFQEFCLGGKNNILTSKGYKLLEDITNDDIVFSYYNNNIIS